MCTSISFRRGGHYFGRNLDVEFSFHEKVVITPRGFLFALRNGTPFRTKFALLGGAAVMSSYPLYYEAANEKGLAMAGLNFPGEAVYLPPAEGRDNISPFEFIPWILGQAESVAQARELLGKMQLTNVPFSPELPLSPLHFVISDKTCSIVVEPTAEGLQIYDNPFDVMTNNPPFAYHLWNMRSCRSLSPRNGEARFTDRYPLPAYGVGMGAIGLPGDTSSASRFVRAAFNLANSRCEDTEESRVAQFFRVLDSVAMVRGTTYTESGKDDITLYSCCINADEGIYYYKTYDRSRLTAVRMTEEAASASALTVFEMRREDDILFEN